MRDLAVPFDLAWIALSKGPGRPGGAVMAGCSYDVAVLVRRRRIFDGAMRQAGLACTKPSCTRPS